MSKPTHVTKGNVLADIMSPQELADAFVDRDTKLVKAEARLKIATEALEFYANEDHYAECGFPSGMPISFGTINESDDYAPTEAFDEVAVAGQRARAALARIKEPA